MAQAQSNQSQEQVSEEVVSDFKSLTRQMIHLIREAIAADTCILYWVNQNRQQFVLAGASTTKMNTIFQDRTPFETHYLNDFLSLRSNAMLQVDRDISSTVLDYYFNGVPVDYIVLFPLISQGELIGILQADFAQKPIEQIVERASNHLKTYGRVLNNYMQLTELQKDEEGWKQHDDDLETLGNLSDENEATLYAIRLIRDASEAQCVLYFSQHNKQWTCIEQEGSVENSSNLVGAIPSEDSFTMQVISSNAEQMVVQTDHKPRLVHVREDFNAHMALGIPLSLRSRRQGCFMVLDSNPYLLNDIKRHKIRDVVRTLSMRLQISLSDTIPPYLCNPHGMLYDKWMELLAERMAQQSTTYLCTAVLKNISKFRINQNSSQLQQFRHEIIKVLMPFSLGLNGITSEHADFVYESLLWNCTEDDIVQWNHRLNDRLSSLFDQFIPTGQDRPSLVFNFRAYKAKEDWLQQKRTLL